MNILLTFDSFKGCMSSDEANAVASSVLQRYFPNDDFIALPLSDGGEGWLVAYQRAVGGQLIPVATHDPMMRRITAHYLRLGDTAVIEVARASGLSLLQSEERNPMRTTSYGTGEILAKAMLDGCRKFVVGLGGSATSDAGIGMIRALIDVLAPSGRFDDIDIIRQCSFTLGSDVTNPLCGERGAAHVFGPQKGADAAMVRALDERARRFAEASARHFGYDRSRETGAGAAGGLGYAFMEYMNATCESGARLLLRAAGLSRFLPSTRFVLTGEGSSDAQTLMGKLPSVLLSETRDCHPPVPVYLFAGCVSDRERLLAAGFAEVRGITPLDQPLVKAMRKDVAQRNLRVAVAEWAQHFGQTDI
ncbi:glycerate kinase [Prevotella sp. A2931]|uniref:Glycerate kinase n=1 Tax=Prevotella illustrans TaxID=2800387 RepID=A0ABS3M7R5_9BACT|nr:MULTISPECIES: glycerate kinase [Prevotella]MBO1364111.1 glycerate kinase [Prevotella illustrans]PTL26045.1 glycerate kinase [Prevotella sp. oral taxon 820]